MKNKGLKKATAVSLSLALAVSVGAALGSAATKPNPLGKESKLITVTRGTASDPNQKFPKGQSLEDNAYTRMLKSKFNIQIKNQFVASNYAQQVNLAISSGKLPDYLTNLTYTQYKAIVKAGLAMDISKVWNDYASQKSKDVYNSNKALFDSLVKQNGKMYAIPSSNPTADFLPVMWIRQDWLDNVGLKAPKNLTELEAVAKAFVTKDPDGNGKADTVGLVGPAKDGKLYQSAYSNNFSLHFDQIFSAYNSFPGMWVKDSKGKVTYGSIQPQTKDALTKVASLYKKGLISKDMLTGKTEQAIANNKAGLFFGTWWNGFADVGNSWKNDKNANWQAFSLPSGSNGVFLAKGGNAAQSFTVISKNAKNPQAVIKMLNIFKDGLSKYVSEEDQTTMGDAAYPMYQTFSMASGPAMVREELVKIYKGQKTQAQVNAYFKNYDAYQNQAIDKIMVSKTKPYSNESISGFDFSGDKANDFGWVWSFGIGLKPYVDGNFKWVNSVSYEKTKTMEKRWANLEKLEYETFSKIVTGQAPVSSFDTFVKKWKAEGGDTIIKEIAN
jgi:putative aldouronate transport system substrate-binding protein